MWWIRDQDLWIRDQDLRIRMILPLARFRSKVFSADPEPDPNLVGCCFTLCVHIVICRCRKVRYFMPVLKNKIKRWTNLGTYFLNFCIDPTFAIPFPMKCENRIRIKTFRIHPTLLQPGQLNHNLLIIISLHILYRMDMSTIRSMTPAIEFLLALCR